MFEFPIQMYTTIFPFITFVATSFAIPQTAGPLTRSLDQKTYVTSNFTLALCEEGKNRFCMRNSQDGPLGFLCAGGKTLPFDEKATAMNEKACEGKRKGLPCFITVVCPLAGK